MNRNSYGCRTPDIRDYGSEPLIVNIDCFTKQNPYYRTALWTGKHLQVHSDVDQFIRIEDGCALVMMGKNKTLLNYQQRVNSNYAVIIPAGTWHNIINIGNTPLKLYSIYAPPQHPFGTVHETKEAAEDAEKY